ncbi:MAG: DUF2252 domain-containing protein [Candidatus Promineifilaceae bacterium]|nr:DUF2252 domain-containing protein [Candidatus Promineifilaceae bacterium]
MAEHHLTVEERISRGENARLDCPRSGHAAWSPAQDRPDPVSLLEAQAKSRIPELVPIRYERMLASPFAFYRGAAVIMAADLSTMPNTGLNVQLCGDAHLSNFGGFASPERDLILDVNDFDETHPGPWEWDVKRLVASVEIAGREIGFDAQLLRTLVLEVAGEYQKTMRECAQLGNLKLWYLHLDRNGIKKRWGQELKHKELKAFDKKLAHASHHDNQRALEKLTRQVDGQLKIAPNPPLIVPVEDFLTGPEQDQIGATIRGLINKYALNLRGDHRKLVSSYDYVHMARKVVGVGSVGTHCWVILMLGRDEQDPLFLQVKEAQASVLEPYLGKSDYDNHGRRVVEGRWLMQTSSDIFLGWDRAVGLDGVQRDFYIRQLWDWKVSLDFETMEPDEALVYGKICAWTLARAHARSGDPIAISAYLGESNQIDNTLADFATAYADQNERDYQALISAANNGRIIVADGG